MVEPGETDWLPLVAVELVQPLGDVAEQDDVLVELQVKVLLLPAVIDVGLAVKVAVGVGLFMVPWLAQTIPSIVIGPLGVTCKRLQIVSAERKL